MTGLVDGKAALVTGGASGIGRATALVLAREGARVLLCDLDEAAGESVVGEIEAGGGEARFARADVSREADVRGVVAATLDAFGALDCAVNNAGVTGEAAAIQDLPLDAWLRTLSINLTGVFLCMKHELPVMQGRGAGSIVNVASGAGLIPVPGMAHYCASKHGVLGLTKTAAHENARSGVRVNAVCPGSTDTPMLRASMQANPAIEKMILGSTPAGRFGTAEEVAEAILWLCSDRAGFVSGTSLLVDGGAIAR